MQKVNERNNIPVTREKILCLNPREWLNDEVINFFLELLKVHNRSHESLPRCYFMNPSKMIRGGKGYEYAGVKRWTRNVNLFEYDMVFVPIHVGGNHWCLATIDFKRSEIR